jgi:hypothetical protein
MIAALSIGLVAFGVSLLTLFSGFGLGTLLMPAFALFFPVDVAVASTAIVHAANNLFKVGILAANARRDVILRFGLPGVFASFLGALLLTSLAGQAPLARWSMAGRTVDIVPVELVMGLLILAFALLELVPALRRWRAPTRWLPVGGALSGFFGGLSGHQGALRAAFLTPMGLSPGQFASTQAVIGLLVDGARLVVYGWTFACLREGDDATIAWPVVAVTAACACAGALLGKRLLPMITFEALHLVVGVLLLVVGLALASGLL